QPRSQPRAAWPGLARSRTGDGGARLRANARLPKLHGLDRKPWRPLAPRSRRAPCSRACARSPPLGTRALVRPRARANASLGFGDDQALRRRVGHEPVRENQNDTAPSLPARIGASSGGRSSQDDLERLEAEPARGCAVGFLARPTPEEKCDPAPDVHRMLMALGRRQHLALDLADLGPNA